MENHDLKKINTTENFNAMTKVYENKPCYLPHKQ